jgi:hypothetical protein
VKIVEIYFPPHWKLEFSLEKRNQENPISTSPLYLPSTIICFPFSVNINEIQSDQRGEVSTDFFFFLKSARNQQI